MGKKQSLSSKLDKIILSLQKVVQLLEQERYYASSLSSNLINNKLVSLNNEPSSLDTKLSILDNKPSIVHCNGTP